MEERNLMGIRAYARHRDVSHSAVSKAIKEGRITFVEKGGKKLIDPEVADIQWKKNTDELQSFRATSGGSEAGQSEIVFSNPIPSSQMEYRDIQRKSLAVDIELKEMTRRQRARELVSVDVADQIIGGSLSKVRDRLLGLGSKISPDLASMTNRLDIEHFLDEEIRKCFSFILNDDDDV